jgi:hypothetical protein
MGQQQPQQPGQSGDPPLGQCAVCGEPVTRDDPGRLRMTVSTGRMSNVHTRCESEEA